MSLLGIRLEGVRNLVPQELELAEMLNVVFGPNASGKTSLLEAVHLLGTARSFRTTHIDQVIQEGTGFLQVSGRVKRDTGSVQVGLRREGKKTRLRVAGENVLRASQLAQVLPVQTLTPASHELLEQGPRYRRRFLDWGVFHVEPRYHQQWTEYYRNLRQRNAALRSGATDRLVRQWDSGLSRSGEELDAQRQHYLTEFRPLFARYAQNLLGQDVNVTLRSGWQRDLTLQDALVEGLASDRKVGFTRSGPHRADLTLSTGGTPVQMRFSRGQQKLLVSALRLAQVNQLQSRRGHAGTMLVDDLAAELDQVHRARLLAQLQQCGSQNFVTVTERELVDLTGWERIKVFHVEHGRIREVL
jgi:DNA replication and repair protein RecF